MTKQSTSGRGSRLFATFIAMLAMALIVTACAASTSSPAASAGGPAASGGPKLAPDLAGDAGTNRKVVPFLTAESSPESVTAITKLIADFEKANPDIAIELQLTSNDNRASRIINAVAVGEELGIFEIERRWVPDFTVAGYLLPLDSIVANIGIDKFIPGSLLYWPWDGHLYQFTSDLSSSTLYYRKDLFDKAGLGTPDSYERILEASQKLNGQNGVSGNALEISNNGVAQRFGTFLWQNCGDFYTETGDVALSNAGSRQAVNDYVELNKYAPEGNYTWGNLDPINAYIAGRAAIALFPGRLGYQVATQAPDIAKVTGNIEARVASGGKGPQVVYGAVTTYAIGSTVKYPNEAKKFLEYMFTGQPLLEFSMGVPGHVAPALKDVQAQILQQDNAYVKDYQAWVKLILDATTYFNHEAQNMGSIKADCSFKKSLVPMPWPSGPRATTPVIATMFQKIALEGQPVDQAYNDAVKAMQSARDSYIAENTWWKTPPLNFSPAGSGW